MQEEQKISIGEEEKDERVQLKNNKQSSFNLGDCPPMEIFWSRLIITATVNAPQLMPDGTIKRVSTERKLLNRVRGIFKSKKFTTIMGPSGSGKTTLMNFIAGRLVSPNLTITGDLMVNGYSVDGMQDYANRIGYVTQDDILLGTMTPLESFWFTANLKLNIPYNQKLRRINTLINDLGLVKCQNTKIGTQLIRGVSGGERKRVSIGVELLTDPSLLFLDEPTTGLDSSTSLQVIELLVELAQSGRTVVSSIHQPSSEIFDLFDQLVLVVKGNIIYQGDANKSIDFFGDQGYLCPKYNNPSDYFMKLMNKEGLILDHLIQTGNTKSMLDPDEVEANFNKRVQEFTNYYKEKGNYRDLKSIETAQVEASVVKYQANFFQQFLEIMKRSLLNEIRNPLDVQSKLIQFIVYSILVVIVFNQLGQGESRIQNIQGMFFFISGASIFAGMAGGLSVFSSQRALFLKERYNYYYSVSSYFWGKSLSELPLLVMYSLLIVGIIYFSIGLSLDPWYKCLICVLIFFSCIWYSSAYGLLISVLFQKIEVAGAIVPIVTLTFFSSAGYFTSADSIPKVLYPFKYLNIYKYGFEAAIINEFQGQHIMCGDDECNPLNGFDLFYDDCWIPILMNLSLGMVVRLIAMVGLQVISHQKQTKLQKTLGSSI